MIVVIVFFMLDGDRLCDDWYIKLLCKFVNFFIILVCIKIRWGFFIVKNYFVMV